MATTKYSAQGTADLFKTGSQSFIDETATIAVPNTTILNRARIPNLAADMRASMGIDRTPIQQIIEMQNELGPNGERVFGALNDDRGAVRFVGNWATLNDDNGQRPQAVTAATSTDFMEITFYGTALNLLIYNDNNTRTYGVSVDGGAPSNVTSSGSVVLAARKYNQNAVLQIVNGLALGHHTVKINNAGSGVHVIFGYEVINASANISVPVGTAYVAGRKISLASPASYPYNSGVTGTRGGRQLLYLTAAGVVASAFQAVNASQSNLALADHSNEELVRSYSFREFGAGRTDDLSSVNSGVSDRAFTLEDGTATITGSSLSTQTLVGVETVFVSAINSSLYFTFIGTGLDVFVSNDASARTDSIYVDGVLIGSLSVAANRIGTEKIVAGLPYGTHTVRIMTGGTAASIRYARFNVYGPKKPTLPVDAIELANYNVFANYSINSSVLVDSVSTGVLRKNALREMTYSGTWLAAAISPTQFASGWNFQSNTNGGYWEYIFFGTGVEWRPLFQSAQAMNLTVSIDGSSNLSGFTTSFVQPGTGLSFAAGTGAITGTSNATNPGLLSINGLTLGMHRIRVTSGNTGTWYHNVIDVITPIHSHESNLYADVQNALPVGSQGIADARKTSMVKEPGALTKAWAQAIGITSGPSTTSSLAIPMPDMALTIKTNGGPIEISYSAWVTNSVVGQAVILQIMVDGTLVGTQKRYEIPVSNYAATVADSFIVPASAGTHSIVLTWFTGSGTITTSGILRNISAKEL